MEPAASEARIGEIQKMFEDSNRFDLQECLEVVLHTEPRQPCFQRVNEFRRNNSGYSDSER
jgi:hypothetical protein